MRNLKYLYILLFIVLAGFALRHELRSVAASTHPPVKVPAQLSCTMGPNQSNYTCTPNIPTALSQLTNDVGYALVTAIPTKYSQLTNDTTVTYTFPATVLVGLNTTTQNIPMAGVVATQATNCRVAGQPQTGLNVDLSGSYVLAGAVVAVLKNNAVLSSGSPIPVRCEVF